MDGFGATAGISLETTRIGPPPFPATGTIDYAELSSLEGPKPAAPATSRPALLTGVEADCDLAVDGAAQGTQELL